MLINFDEETGYSAVHKIDPRCPDCGTTMQTNGNRAWTEKENVIVAPLFCVKCRFSASIFIIIEHSESIEKCPTE